MEYVSTRSARRSSLEPSALAAGDDNKCLDKNGQLLVTPAVRTLRLSHWLNVLILLGLILSGISIYWASPIYRRKPDANTGNYDVAADVGIWIFAQV